MIGGNISINKFIKIGTFASGFNNLSPSIARMNHLSPILTNVYLDTPPMGPTPEPLEYATPPGRIGRPHGYPQTSTGEVLHTGAIKSTPPPTHPRLLGHTHRCIPPLVRRNRAGSFKVFTSGKSGGTPGIFLPQGLERPNPPLTPTGRGGGGGVRGCRVSVQVDTGPKQNHKCKIGGNPWKIWSPGAVHPPASSRAPARRDSLQTPPVPHKLKQRGVPLANFGLQTL